MTKSNSKTAYKGFELVDLSHTSVISAWQGGEMVGSMPDRPTIKAYIDWLETVGMEAAGSLGSLDGAIDGHVVTVHGGQPDEQARLIDRLGAIPARLQDPMVESDALRKTFGELVWTIRGLDIAADNARTARRIDNFFVTSEHLGDKPATRLHLGNFGLPGEWNGSGHLALGIGDGWVRPVIDQILASPFPRNPDVGTVQAGSTSAYARNVFVEGLEPVLDKSELTGLREVETALSNALSWGPSVPHRQQNIRYAEATLQQLVDSIRAARAPEAPAPAL